MVPKKGGTTFFICLEIIMLEKVEPSYPEKRWNHNKGGTITTIKVEPSLYLDKVKYAGKGGTIHLARYS